ncbi:3'-5' exonuclease [Tsukamurella pulmonis]|uniref:exonuclease domain-containing protein n=1 Tax=Tsukamurella pulmonis TaxID=47312 RepID=UPI001EDEEB6B|nr:exonuclease domain-containing protein [Tsukamurella pulmonis]BDD81430.1 3'-5' exonuclease [Tsukamurella pulmonis]
MTGPFWYEFPVTYLDFETSGIDADSFIVSCCLGDLARDEFDEDPAPRVWLAKPPTGRAIPESATAVHGISTEQAQREGMDYGRVVAEIVDAVNTAVRAGRAIVAYNLAFDWSLLTREAHRLGLTLEAPALFLDPFVIDKGVDRYRRGKRTLVAACDVFGVTMRGDAHDACADAVAAGELARRMADLVASSGPDSAATAELKYLNGLDASGMVAWQQAERGRQMDGLRDYFDRSGIQHDGCDGGWPVLDAVRERVAA